MKLIKPRLYRLDERYFEGKRYYQAQTILPSALLRDASQAKAYNLFGLALACDPARRSLAEACFANAVHLAPENLEYRRNLAELAGTQPLSEKARTLLYGSQAEPCLNQRAVTKAFARFRKQQARAERLDGRMAA
jgi:tetratricopeptide (TPR) repeat protein